MPNIVHASLNKVNNDGQKYDNVIRSNVIIITLKSNYKILGQAEAFYKYSRKAMYFCIKVINSNTSFLSIKLEL